jgi:uncharacterized protein GlcG (DUF336 family)
MPNAITSSGRLTTSTALPALYDDNNVIGAVGVSGSLPDDNEACAIHGIAAAGLRADLGAADPT